MMAINWKHPNGPSRKELINNQQSHASWAAQVDSSSLGLQGPASLSISPHVSYGLGGLEHSPGPTAEKTCRAAFLSLLQTCLLGLGSLSSWSSGGSSGLTITLSLGPRFSKPSSWERAEHRLSRGIARNCRGVKSGITGERSKMIHAPLASIVFSSLHRCPLVQHPWLSNSFCSPFRV